MKKNALTILLFLLSVIVVYAQSVIENPKTGFSQCNYVKITKVELTNSSTILYFHTWYTPGQWILIPGETYIQPVGAEKLFVKKAEGIKLNDQHTMPASGEVSYVLTFPAIPKTTNYIDYGEANEGGSWFIYDIQTRPTDCKSNLPKELSGNWFDKSTGNWGLGFFDKYIVYKNKVWSYSFIKNEKELNSVKLNSDGKAVELFYNTATSGALLIGESAQSLKEYSNNATEAKRKKPADDKPYELPVFKIDSATYSGYIKDYTPRIGIKTLTIFIDNIFNGSHNWDSYVIKIAENGFFSAKLPVYYPHICRVNSSFYNGEPYFIFLEPGKELFQLMGDSDPTLFMGSSARINSDISELIKIRDFDERSYLYQSIFKKILDMTPAQYKTYCMNCGIKDMKALDSIMATNTISAKAYQVMKLEWKYGTEEAIMDYKTNLEVASRVKNNIPDSQWTSPIKADFLTADYLNFINNESANNPFAILSSNYNAYISQLKFLDILEIEGTILYPNQTLVYVLEKWGPSLAQYERMMIETMDQAHNFEKLGPVLTESEKKMIGTMDSILNFNEYKRMYEFNLKYKSILEDILKVNHKADHAFIYNYLKEKKIKLTSDEKKLWKTKLKYDESDLQNKTKEFCTIYADSIQEFYLRHHSDQTELYYQKCNANRKEKIRKLFGIEPGLASDVMVVQDNCRELLKGLSPVDNIKLKRIQQQLHTPFIADYVALCNNRAIEKMEANKRKTGNIVSVVKEVPKTDADKIFDAIIENYKGKVVYVDFWATWCGPCRVGIKQIKPLKEELDGKDIAFVYITGETSPLNTWTKLIPDIQGEHYRVSDDEWNFLTAKFSISGIPHYVLVGKNGKVINPHLGHLDNERLKSELTKYIND